MTDKINYCSECEGVGGFYSSAKDELIDCPTCKNKKNYCSAAGYCLAENIVQQSECKYFIHSVNEKNEYCLLFKFGRCFCADAKEEATRSLVAAVKNQITPRWCDV